MQTVFAGRWAKNPKARLARNYHTLDPGQIDSHRTFIARHIVREHRPDLMLVHYNELDKTQHRLGPGHPEALASLERLDALFGQLLDEYAAAGCSQRSIVCVVSDHGFERVDHLFRPNAVLREAGLIDYDERSRCITGWRARAWVSGASAALMLADRDDRDALKKARSALEAYAGKPDSPIGRFIESEEIRRIGSNPDAAFMMDGGRGWMYSRSVAGPATGPSPIHGMHGQMPDRPELAAALVISGPGIPQGRLLDRVSILDIAPTLARLAGVSMGQTTGQTIPELVSTSRR